MGDSEETPEFEYTTFDLAKPSRDVEGLNKLGRDGWEAAGGQLEVFGLALSVGPVASLHPALLDRPRRSPVPSATRADCALAVASSHAVAHRFPYCCLCNHPQEHLVKATDGILGTHRVKLKEPGQLVPDDRSMQTEPTVGTYQCKILN